MTNFLHLQVERLDLNAISELITHESCGAVSFFVGTTRDNFDDKQVVSLEYEAYDRMALKSMGQICDELRKQWPDIKHIALHHRLGVVPVREASVIIGISSPHRQTSLQAVQQAIDRLKQIVPIWKKERYQNADGAAPACGQTAKPPQRRKRRAVDFNSCMVPVELPSEVPQRLVQIHANAAEVRRRLNCFVDQKRDEINQSNVQDFIEPTDPIRQQPATGEEGGCAATENEEMSCARIRSSVFRSKDASSHLRIHRVKNECGPQERQNYTDALDKLMTTAVDGEISEHKAIKLEMGNPSICERLFDTENAVGLKPTPRNVYARLKAIEQRIQFLETASPEYSHFVSSGIASSVHASSNSTKPHRSKQTYTPADVDLFIQKMQQSSTASAPTT